MSKKCAHIMFFLAGSVMALATSYVGLPKGTIYQAYVEYEDADSIVITAGYGECNGNYFEVTESRVYDVNYIPTGEDFIYIYVDDSESEYPSPAFCDSTAEPAWSDAKLGWYNGDDRCIGVVWTEDSSSEIKFFTNNSNNRFMCHFGALLYHGSPVTSMTPLEATAYIPVNAKAVFVEAINYKYQGVVQIIVSSYENETMRILGWSYFYTACSGWIELERGASRDLKYRGGEIGDTPNINIQLFGCEIER